MQKVMKQLAETEKKIKQTAWNPDLEIGLMQNRKLPGTVHASVVRFHEIFSPETYREMFREMFHKFHDFPELSKPVKSSICSYAWIVLCISY